MAGIGIANLSRYFVHLIFLGIEQHTGMIQFMVEQITVDRISINFFKAGLQLKGVQPSHFGEFL